MKTKIQKDISKIIDEWHIEMDKNIKIYCPPKVYERIIGTLPIPKK